MPTWVPVVVSLLVAVLTVVANAIVNARIKFARDSTEASRELKRLGFGTTLWVLNALLVCFVIYDIWSSEPLTPLRVFDIAAGVAVLAFAASTYLMKRNVDSLWRAVLRLHDTQARHLALIERIVDASSTTDSRRLKVGEGEPNVES